jgi:hypothetical protein
MHIQVGVIQTQYTMFEERLEKAQQSLQAREADLEACDVSVPKVCYVCECVCMKMI